MTLYRKTLPSLLAAAMLAGSSFALAADNKAGDNKDNVPRDQQTTGSINSEGRTPTPEEREYCMTAPAGDATCEGLGLTPTR